MPDEMGLLRTDVELENPVHAGERRRLRQVLVDTGAELSWAPANILESLGIARVKLVRFHQADGSVLERWVGEQYGRFSVCKAVATSIAFVGYNFDLPSAELANQIREKASVLVAPGGYLGTENHLRITVGYEPKKVRMALERIGAVAAELARTNVAAVRG